MKQFLNAKYLLAVLLILLVQGCATMLPEKEAIRFRDSTSELTVIKWGCVIEEGTYKDRTDQGNSYPYAKFIAIDKNGNTVGQWAALCNAVVPNGTSNCSISGPRRAHFECGNYQQYQRIY